jgi:hypothetical protein
LLFNHNCVSEVQSVELLAKFVRQDVQIAHASADKTEPAEIREKPAKWGEIKDMCSQVIEADELERRGGKRRKGARIDASAVKINPAETSKMCKWAQV